MLACGRRATMSLTNSTLICMGEEEQLACNTRSFVT